MAVGGQVAVDGTAEVELLDDGGGTEIHVLQHSLFNSGLGDLSGAEGVHQHRDRLGHADGVSNLHLAVVGQTGGHHVLGDVAGGVGGGAIHLGGILTRESAAAVTGVAAVGVHDDLTAGQTCITGRAADDEAAGGVDEELGVLVQ